MEVFIIKLFISLLFLLFKLLYILFILHILYIFYSIINNFLKIYINNEKD